MANGEDLSEFSGPATAHGVDLPTPAPGAPGYGGPSVSGPAFPSAKSLYPGDGLLAYARWALPPQYANLSDANLASFVRRTYYPQLDPRDFYRRTGIPDPGGPLMPSTVQDQSALQNALARAGAEFRQMGDSTANFLLRGGPFGMMSNWLASKIGAPTQDDNPVLGLALRAVNADMAQVAANAKPLDSTFSGQSGKIVAGLAPFALGGALGAAAKAPAVTEMFLPTSLRNMALQGAALGAMDDANSPSQVAGNTILGGLGGTFGYGIGRGLTALPGMAWDATLGALTNGGAMRNAANYFARYGVKDADALGARVAYPQLPGVQPPSAVAYPGSAIPGISNRFAVDNNAYAGALNARNLANQSAASDAAVGTFDPTTLATLEANRKAASDAAFGAVRQQGNLSGSNAAQVADAIRQTVPDGTDKSQVLDAIINGLSIPIKDNKVLATAAQRLQDALSSGRWNQSNSDLVQYVIQQMKQRGGTLADAGQAIDSALGDATSKTAQNALQSAKVALTQTTQPQTNGDMLLGVKEAIENAMAKNPELANSPDFWMIRKALTDQMESASPAMKAAMDIYRSMSPGIDQQRTLQSIVGPGGAGLGPSGTVSPTRLGNALARGDYIAQKATGFGGSTLENTLSPEQLATLRQASDYMTAARNAASAQSAGSTQSIGNKILSGLHMYGFLPHVGGVGVGASVPGKVLSSLAGMVGSPMDSMIANGLLNPDVLVKILASRNTLSSKISRAVGTASGITGATNSNKSTSGQ